ncbi:MAG: NlpC/P60 family protein [Firmicutes bacterium]|nr:NlpC/P60 family protein [Bacillota bacterium]
MTKVKRRLRGVDYLVIFLIFIFSVIFSLTVRERYKKREIYLISNVVSNKGIYLNKSEYYVAINSEVELDIDNKYNINYSISFPNNDILRVENNKIIANNYGDVKFEIIVDNEKMAEGIIYVIKGLRKRDNEFDKTKTYVSCNEFSEEENELLDKALIDRVDSAGNMTRAGVVEVIRFITLDFDRRIAYFYENGRLNSYGQRKVDGEGRYYHKGLYISEKKYDDIAYKLTGPASWGCPLTQFTTAARYGFSSGGKMPNGFDCSGFVSWVLYNGGFDVNDSGAGDIPSRHDDLYDLGEKRFLNQELLDSGLVKVGDLVAYSGHMAIIGGIDNEGYYYVAESLPNFKGVVLNKYDQYKLKNTFTHIMLMDSVYKEDGKLTNMWY